MSKWIQKQAFLYSRKRISFLIACLFFSARSNYSSLQIKMSSSDDDTRSRLAQVLSNTWTTLDNEEVKPITIKKFLRQNSSFDLMHFDQRNESKVLVLYTGGTIGKAQFLPFLAPENQLLIM